MKCRKKHRKQKKREHTFNKLIESDRYTSDAKVISFVLFLCADQFPSRIKRDGAKNKGLNR